MDEEKSDSKVEKLQAEIKNHELKASHTKIALNNLEKSISTYHDKLEALEGANIEYRNKSVATEEILQRYQNEISEKTCKISQLEEFIRQSKQSSNFDSRNQTDRIQQLEQERNELLENNSIHIEQSRILQVRLSIANRLYNMVVF